MKHGPPTLARLFAWSVLLLGLSVGCGSGCGGDPVNPPVVREMPDADRSSVEVSKALGARANGRDSVDIKVTVRKDDGTPMAGRTMKVTVSGEGNTLTQPAGATDDQGVATAKLSSSVAGTKTVTVSVDAEGGPVTLSSRPTIEFITLPAAKLVFTAAPSSGTAGAVLGAFDVTIQNADGETVTSANNTVTVALGSSPESATLKGTQSATAVNGVAHFSELIIEKASAGYTLVASAEGLTGATSSSFAVAPAAAATLTLSHAVAPVTAGSPVSVELVLHDAYGNEATGYTGTVRFSSDDAAATLPADYTFTAADLGRHAFTDGIALTRAGTRKVTVTDTAAAALTDSAELAVVPAAARKLVFTQQAPGSSVRAPFGVELTLTDVYGNVAPVGGPAVSLSLNKGTLEGFAPVSPSNGVVTISGLSIAQEDSGYVLTASGDGLDPVVGNAFTITDDVAPSAPMLASSATPTSATITWTAVGDDGTAGTATSYDLRFSTSDIVSDMDFLAATPVAVGAPNSSGTPESAMISGLMQGTTYFVALKVTDNQGNAVRTASHMFSTPYPTADKVVFTVEPKNGTAGTNLATIKVEIQDSTGLIVGNADSVVRLTVQGATGFGPFDVPANKGEAIFDNVRIDKAGTGYTLVATSGGLSSDTSASFDIEHAPASRLALSGPGSKVYADTDHDVQVTAYDPFDNLAEGYAGTVSFTSTDADAVLPADYSFISTDKGQHTFTKVKLKTVGTQRITASDGVASGFLETEVIPQPPGKLVLSGLPSEVTAGAEATITVECLDGFDARDLNYTGTVRFTSSDARAVLPAEYTFTSEDKGIKEFKVTLRTANVPPALTSLTVQDTELPSFTATANTAVKWGDAAKLVVQAPGSVKAGDPLSVKVTAFDSQDNLVKDYTGMVHFSADADASAMPEDYTFALADEGSRQFSITLKTAGSTKLTIADAARGLSTDHTVAVSSSEASELVLVAPTGPVTAGQALTFDVTLKDAFGNVATGYTGTVHFASSDSQAALPADYLFTSGDMGHKAFSVTLKTVNTTGTGEQSVTVKDLANDALAQMVNLQVQPDAPKKLAFRGQPASSTRVRESVGTVSVAITDAFGNIVNVDTPEITLALAGGNPAAVLNGTVKAMPVAGLATFTGLSVTQQGTNFRFDAVGGPLDGASSTPFTIVDDVAPRAVSLSVVSKTSILMELAWKAVGDDDLNGDATSYDLRYSTSPITAANFDAATAVTLGAPLPQGSDESATLTRLTPNTQYYVALKVKDDANNVTLSFADPAQTKTNVDPCAGYTCTVPSPTCAADGISQVTYTETCVDVDNAPTCQESTKATACTGTNAVCFNGTCGTAAKPAANQLSVSEVMHAPSAGTTEYFEVTNNTNNLLNLNGLTVTYKNGSGVTKSFLVGSGTVPVVIDRKGTFVLAQNKDKATNGGVSANYQYDSSIQLDGSGQFLLANGATAVEDFTYTSSFPQTPGKAMSLSSIVVGTKANANPWYWCDADVQLVAGGDYGTPNVANSACGMTVTPPVDWCNVQFPKTMPSTIAGTSTTIYSRFYEPSVTDRNTAGNDGYPYVFAELGYGQGTTAADTWTWTPISFNGGYAPAVSNDDEMMGTLQILVPGSYRYGFRYYFKDPVTGTSSPYVYCDQNGPTADPASGIFGDVTITPYPPAGHLVISEFASKNLKADGVTVDHNDEFIELYNPTSSAVDLTTWKIQYKSTTGIFGNLGGLTLTGSIPAKGYYLIAYKTGYTGSVTPNATYTALTAHSGGSLQIVDPSGAVVDRLAWGTGTGLAPEGTAAPSIPAGSESGSIERKADIGSTAASMQGSGYDATHGNGYDSDNNAQDFVMRTTRDPQNASSATEAQ